VQSSNPISLKKYLNLKGLLSFGHNLIFKGWKLFLESSKLKELLLVNSGRWAWFQLGLQINQIKF
jgi:hypothetical protein